MRLISCDIENFGKLSGFHMDFQEGINYIYGENGWGKSTLAAFIRIAFYGMANDSKKDRMERDRTRYLPWQGGVYGGRLSFAMGDKSFIIERSFGVKASEDCLVVRDGITGLETEELGRVPGELVFGLDAVSFSNSVFVQAGDCAADITSGIKTRLGEEGLEYQDLGLYDQAETKLHEYLNKMSPTRATGLLNKEKKKLADMEYRLSFKEHYETLAIQQNREIEESKDRLEALKVERKRLGLENRRQKTNEKKTKRVETKKKSTDGVRLLLAVICLVMWLAAGTVYYLRKDIIITAVLAVLGLICIVIRRFYSKRKFDIEYEDESQQDFINERIEVLTDDIEARLEGLARLSGDLKDTNRMLKELETLSEEYTGLKEKYEEEYEAYKDAKITKELLEEAKNNLMLKFTTPLKEAFARNYDIMTGTGGENVTLDVKGRIGWIEAGAQRDIRSLSTGYQDIVGLCTRMAYIDIMYRKETPFIIMDDPFVHLDENNKEGAERLLIELGKKHQVIYFTCSQGLS